MATRKPTFYCVDGMVPSDPALVLLKKACEKRKVTFVHVMPKRFNPAKDALPQVGDILYRVGTTEPDRIMEAVFDVPGVITFRKQKNSLHVRQADSYLVSARNGLPTPKTVDIVTGDKEILKACVDLVGGFPVILKATGGSHGVGVMRIDSLPGLFSVVDFVLSQGTKLVMREFIESDSHARLLVLGDKVIDSIEYKAQAGDFRTNAGTPVVAKKAFGKDVQATAVKAVGLMGVDFGGVDIIIDKDNKHYLLEVNFPAFFPRAQNITGVDTAGMIVDYLVAKSTKR